MSYQDCDKFLGRYAQEAEASLEKLGLSYVTSKRINTLPPLRRYVLTLDKLSNPDLDRWVKHYLDLTRGGERLLGPHGKAEMDRLKPEVANIAAALTCASANELRNVALDSVLGYGEFVRTSGLGSSEPLADLSEACMAADDPSGAALCLFWKGKIARERTEYAVATAAFERASVAYEKAGNPQGKANCVWSVGAIKQERGDYDGAETDYRASLEIHRQFNNGVGQLGQAYAHEGLGEIELARGNFDAAINQYHQGLAKYKSINNVRGIANCIYGLGKVEAKQSRSDESLKLYDKAYGLYTSCASQWGRANCHKAKGDIARRQGDLPSARQEYELAKQLYREVGDRWGRANCIMAIGDLNNDAGAKEDSSQCYRGALDIFNSIGNAYYASLVQSKLDDGQIGLR